MFHVEPSTPTLGFHVKHMSALVRALTWSGIDPDPGLLARFRRFGEWLRDEAAGAGGIGPGELDRLEVRHLADSVVFEGVSRARPHDPVLDVGSGVGLPGIPLALLRPERPVTLLDRSGKRVALARRAVRVLELANVDVVQGELESVDIGGRVVVSRASVPPDRWRSMLPQAPKELLIGGSHVRRPEVPGFETVEIPAEILDRPVWILRMAQL